MAKKQKSKALREMSGGLTNRQITFAKHIVEGIYSNTECALKAGYSPRSARTIAAHLLDGVTHPDVVEYIADLREERERRYGVTTIGQLKRLSELSKGAEEANQFSAAINAEKLRSALGGLTIDRRETINTLDQLSRDEITARLAALQQKYPQAFAVEASPMKDVTPNGDRTRGELLGRSEAFDAEELDGDED